MLIYWHLFFFLVFWISGDLTLEVQLLHISYVSIFCWRSRYVCRFCQVLFFVNERNTSCSVWFLRTLSSMFCVRYQCQLWASVLARLSVAHFDLPSEVKLRFRNNLLLLHSCQVKNFVNHMSACWWYVHCVSSDKMRTMFQAACLSKSMTYLYLFTSFVVFCSICSSVAMARSLCVLYKCYQFQNFTRTDIYIIAWDAA